MAHWTKRSASCYYILLTAPANKPHQRSLPWGIEGSLRSAAMPGVKPALWQSPKPCNELNRGTESHCSLSRISAGAVPPTKHGFYLAWSDSPSSFPRRYDQWGYGLICAGDGAVQALIYPLLYYNFRFSLHHKNPPSLEKSFGGHRGCFVPMATLAIGGTY